MIFDQRNIELGYKEKKTIEIMGIVCYRFHLFLISAIRTSVTEHDAMLRHARVQLYRVVRTRRTEFVREIA